jgi:nucleoside-diphosphate-sugar epimerase
MTTPKLIVVAGAAGRLGRLTVDALRSHPGVRVRALVRDPHAPAAAGLHEGAEVMAFDATTAGPDQLAAATGGAFAVISTLQGGPDIIVDAQLALLRAAKAAGARRFIPSDYSYNIFTLPAGININSDWRRTLAEHARGEVTASFEVVHVMQGIFADRVVTGFMGLIDSERGVLRYWGDGQTPIDWTTWEDTARYIAAAALDDRPVPAHLFVAGERSSALEVAALWEQAYGRPMQRERLGSLEELTTEIQRRLSAEPHNMYAWLPLMYAQGVFGGQALLGPLENGRYPQIVAETVAQALARGAL